LVRASTAETSYVVLQEGAYPTAGYSGCQDAHILYYDHGTAGSAWNTGGHNYIEEGDWNADPLDPKEALIQFDLAGQAIADVTEATLHLYYSYQRNTTVAGMDHTGYAIPILKEWNEGRGLGVDGEAALDGEVTWQSAKHNQTPWQSWTDPDALVDYSCGLDAARSGGAYGPKDVDLARAVACDELYGFEPKWVTWDVTDIVRAWVSGALDNNGVKITQQTQYSACEYVVQGGFDFISSNNAEVARRPILIIRSGGSAAGAFNRGDANADGTVNIADAIFALGYLFGGGPAPVCMDTADANDDGAANIADAVTILGHLFGGAGPLKPPFRACGPDPTADTLPACNFPPGKCP
jgi:hypothetical protein